MKDWCEMRVWLFDIDGTLISSGGAGGAAVLTAMRSAFAVEPNYAGISFCGRTDRAIVSEIMQRSGIHDSEENWLRFREVYLKHLPAALHQRGGSVLSGVIELIEKLHDDERSHLGLLTGNIRDGAAKKLVHFELWDYFCFGGFGDQHKSRDDVAADAFASAAEALGEHLQPEDVWVVGDTVNDITCARAVGMNVIAVATGTVAIEDLRQAQPDRLLESLASTDQIDDLLP